LAAIFLIQVKDLRKLNGGDQKTFQLRNVDSSLDSR